MGVGDLEVILYFPAYGSLGCTFLLFSVFTYLLGYYTSEIYFRNCNVSHHCVLLLLAIKLVVLHTCDIGMSLVIIIQERSLSPDRIEAS